MPTADWYPDPALRADLRYWDGDCWTRWVAAKGDAYEEDASIRPAPGERDPSRRRRLLGLSVTWEPPFDLAEELDHVIGGYDDDVARVIADVPLPRPHELHGTPPSGTERAPRHALFESDVCVLAQFADEPHVHVFDAAARRIGLVPTFVNDLSYLELLTVADQDGPRCEVQFTRSGAEVRVSSRDGSPASSLTYGGGGIADEEGAVFAEVVRKPELALVEVPSARTLARYPKIGFWTVVRERRLLWLECVVFERDAPIRVRAAALAGILIAVREADKESHIG